MCAAAAPAAARDFEHPADHTAGAAAQQFGIQNPQRADTPTDPGYDSAEPDDADNGVDTNIYDEQFGLFGWPSQRSRATALYLTGPNATACQPALLLCPQVSGFNASGAWKLDRGRPDTTIAILDTGIKWDRDSLRRQIHLNAGELPVPQHDRANPSSDASLVPACANWQPSVSNPHDANGDGAFNVLDYVCDSRVSPSAGAHGASGVDAEDLIATFSDSNDDDANGFVDDIAGWDFFDNDNDPYDASSYFAASNHGSGRATDAAEQGNEGQGGIGVCPHCSLLPIRTWDTFVSDGDTFGMGILYATDNGASVIEGANGSVYHSAFAEQASNYAYGHGVVQTFSGDDLNTGNHNYAANYGHAMLIQGTVPDTMGLGNDAGSQVAQALEGLCGPIPLPVGCPGTSLPVGTYFRGANTTQYGGKSSIAMEGSTGSENTGKAAGAAGLVISAARDASPPVQLRPDETREILEQTAERVTTGNTLGTGVPDPAADPTKPSIDQWTSHFGWGRVDLGKAATVAQSGKIPPEAAIDSPDWYAPVTGNSLAIHGLARARFATGGAFHWKVEWGAGEAPTSWNTVSSGDSTADVSDFGAVDMTAVRAALQSFNPPPDTGGPTLSTVSPNPYRSEFTVRLVVRGDGIPTPGVDRRVFTSARDSTLRNGFPKRMGTGGEAPIRYADLNGDNVQELVVPTEDGVIHAYEPDGSELPGWPVHTELEASAAGHDAAPGFAALAAGSPPREPPRGPVIADLDNDGRPEVITTAGQRIYAWEPDGSVRPGFPVRSETSFCNPANESQPLVHPKCGFVSSPAVGHLEGQDQPLDIVAPALDGHLYAVDGSGQALPGFPKQLVDPAVPPSQQMIAESINEPADRRPQRRRQGRRGRRHQRDVRPDRAHRQRHLRPARPGPLRRARQRGRRLVAGLRGRAAPTASFLPGWPIKLNGAIQSTLPLIGPGQDPALVKVGGQQLVVASTTGSASIGEYDTSGNLVRDVQQGAYGPASDATDRTGTINLFESASVGNLTPAGGPDIVKYGLSLTDVANLLLVGQNAPYNHLIGAYEAQTGTPLPAFPRITDDFQFLSSSDVARVTPGSTNQVVAGTGLGLLHAYDGATGTDVSGFPKVTGGWLFAPAAFSSDGRMADITREGYLFQWNLPNLPKCQAEWPQFRHDQQDSGNYDRDGTPPSTPTGLSVKSGTLTFKAPGDDNACGTAARYEIVTSPGPIDPASFAGATPLAGAPTPLAAGATQTYDLPAHDRYVAVRAIDEAGNVGWDAQVDTGGSNPPPPPVPPRTLIKHKHVNKTHGRARFKVTARGGKRPYAFQCKLRRENRKHQPTRWATCRRRVHYTDLRPGRYRFAVRAIGADGARDRTPSHRHFRIPRPTP